MQNFYLVEFQINNSLLLQIFSLAFTFAKCIFTCTLKLCFRQALTVTKNMQFLVTDLWLPYIYMFNRSKGSNVIAMIALTTGNEYLPSQSGLIMISNP